MPNNYMTGNQAVLTSIYGTRLGLQRLSTAQSGGTRGAIELTAGPDGFHDPVSTAATTAINVRPLGLTVLPGTSAASSAVYTIDPPIPGVRALIYGATDNGPVYLKTANGENFISSMGSTFNTIKVSSLGGAFELYGLSTADFICFITSGTSSQASGFGMTTST